MTRPRPRMLALLGLLLFALAAGCAGNVSVPTPVPGAVELKKLATAQGATPLPDPPTVPQQLVTLGQALFFDKILSGNRDVSCATCHWPELGTSDARPLPDGVDGAGLGLDRSGGAIVPRHSPHVLNTKGMVELFWDGRVRLWGKGVKTPAGPALTDAMQSVFDRRWRLQAAQALFPVTSREEMRGHAGENELADIDDADLQGIWRGLTARLVAIPAYRKLFFAAYPNLTSTSEITFAHAANAIGAFEVAAFTRTDSPWERFVRGDDHALTEAQIAGGREFFGRAGCTRCHLGGTFTDRMHHNIGLVQFGPGKGDGAGHEDYGRERVTGRRGQRYQFRTPTLLNVELTAPYGHLGQFRTLQDMVGHYENAWQSLMDYDIREQVTEASLHGTDANNRDEIAARLDRRLRGKQPFDVAAVVEFLTALTADSARDLSDIIPQSVPSGLTVR